MELREWAIRILSAQSLDDKLFSPVLLTDAEPGPAIRWEEPSRPPNMGLNKRSKEEKLPSFHELGLADNRAACLHRFAGHELLAVEIMAFTLLAFPEANSNFRKGLTHTLLEEQGHVKLYMKEMSRLGIRFGDLPLFRHFWKHTPYILSPLHYVSIMSLTFEMANLDFAPMYGKSFFSHGDMDAANLMSTIWKDEIRHVGFGLQWFRKLNHSQTSEWEAWNQVLSDTLLTPKRAKGFVVYEEPRMASGISQEWINRLKTL